MKGKNHLRMGACTVGVVASVGLLPIVEAPAVVAAGIGLFMFGKVAPDLDLHTSAISRSWGWLSRAFSVLFVRPTARWVYHLSRARGDSAKPVVHRGFTHTLPGALVIGVVAGWTILSGPLYSAICLGLMIGGAARVYDRSWLGYGALAGAAVGWFAWLELIVAAPWLMLVIAVGCFAHSIDDCTTTSGAPLWWPLIDLRTMKRWGRYGTPEWMRYDTGSGAETALVWACIIATSGLLYWVFVSPLLAPILLETFTNGVG